MLNANRSFVKYVILSIVTCGIYHWIFMHGFIKDMNIIGDGDGEETADLAKLILLSIVTCGIYSWIFYYKLGNRMYNNGSRYNVTINENGTTILLWMILGSWLCGIGFYVAWYILINNMNKLAEAYN